jgi:hypothetical protein
MQPPALNDREQQGLIKVFKYTFKLIGHAYNRATADAIGTQIPNSYLPYFLALRLTLERRLLQEGG